MEKRSNCNIVVPSLNLMQHRCNFENKVVGSRWYVLSNHVKSARVFIARWSEARNYVVVSKNIVRRVWILSHPMGEQGHVTSLISPSVKAVIFTSQDCSLWHDRFNEDTNAKLIFQLSKIAAILTSNLCELLSFLFLLNFLKFLNVHYSFADSIHYPMQKNYLSSVPSVFDNGWINFSVIKQNFSSFIVNSECILIGSLSD